MIDGLFERAGHIPIWLLSLGNEVVTLGELEEKMKRLGRETRAIEIRHQHLPAVATEEKKERNREFLVMGWDPEAPLLRDRLVHEAGFDGRDAKLSNDTVDVHARSDARGSAGSSTDSLADDRLHQSDSALIMQGIPRLRGQAVVEPQASVDPPHACRNEVTMDKHAVFLGGSASRHELQDYSRGPMSQEESRKWPQ
jgi:hypothetical protein